jgi:hypothetical protein
VSMSRSPTAKSPKEPSAPNTADAKRTPTSKTPLAERLKALGGVEVPSPFDGGGFVITGVSGFMRPKTRKDADALSSTSFRSAHHMAKAPGTGRAGGDVRNSGAERDVGKMRLAELRSAPRSCRYH